MCDMGNGRPPGVMRCVPVVCPVAGELGFSRPGVAGGVKSTPSSAADASSCPVGVDAWGSGAVVTGWELPWWGIGCCDVYLF